MTDELTSYIEDRKYMIDDLNDDSVIETFYEDMPVNLLVESYKLLSNIDVPVTLKHIYERLFSFLLFDVIAPESEDSWDLYWKDDTIIMEFEQSCNSSFTSLYIEYDTVMNDWSVEFDTDEATYEDYYSGVETSKKGRGWTALLLWLDTLGWDNINYYMNILKKFNENALK